MAANSESETSETEENEESSEIDDSSFINEYYSNIVCETTCDDCHKKFPTKDETKCGYCDYRCLCPDCVVKCSNPKCDDEAWCDECTDQTDTKLHGLTKSYVYCKVCEKPFCGDTQYSEDETCAYKTKIYNIWDDSCVACVPEVPTDVKVKCSECRKKLLLSDATVGCCSKSVFCPECAKNICFKCQKRAKFCVVHDGRNELTLYPLDDGRFICKTCSRCETCNESIPIDDPIGVIYCQNVRYSSGKVSILCSKNICAQCRVICSKCQISFCEPCLTKKGFHCSDCNAMFCISCKTDPLCPTCGDPTVQKSKRQRV